MTLNAPSFDIMTLLDAEGKGVTGQDLFASTWGKVGNQEVNEQVLIVDRDSSTSPLPETYENVTFQVMARGKINASFKPAHDKLRDIYEFLAQAPVQDVNGTGYNKFNPVGPPSSLGRDDTGRPLWTMNFFSYRNAIA